MHNPGFDSAGPIPVPTGICLQQRCSAVLEYTQTWSSDGFAPPCLTLTLLPFILGQPRGFTHVQKLL